MIQMRVQYQVIHHLHEVDLEMMEIISIVNDRKIVENGANYRLVWAFHIGRQISQIILVGFLGKKLAIILGSIFGGLAFVGLLILLIYCLCCRNKEGKDQLFPLRMKFTSILYFSIEKVSSIDFGEIHHYILFFSLQSSSKSTGMNFIFHGKKIFHLFINRCY